MTMPLFPLFPIFAQVRGIVNAQHGTHYPCMLTLFLRAIFMYLFVFLILRLTGKRQVSDLQPFDLLITLLIADLAGCAIADTGIPLVYSIVPILGMYFVQQLVTHVCLKSARTRRMICGSPVLLIRNGAVMEEAMRETHYTLVDLMDQLRESGCFDLNEIAFAILETNGTMSVLQKKDAQPATCSDLNLPAGEDAKLSYMLILDGEICHNSLATLNLSEKYVTKLAADLGGCQVKDVFFLHRGGDGRLTLQKKARCGGERVERA
jgi:uncharacterized membrane protein YcaP (DUF421 family)